MKHIISILLISLFCISFVSAVSLDKSIKKDITTSKYGKININDGTKKLIDIELKENSEGCKINCYANGTYTIYQDGIFISKIKFKVLNGGRWYTYSTFKDYKIYIKDNKGWKEYKEGDSIKAGNYEFRLEGTKKEFQTLDWIIYFNDVALDEWAYWGVAHLYPNDIGNAGESWYNETSGSSHCGGGSGIQIVDQSGVGVACSVWSSGGWDNTAKISSVNLTNYQYIDTIYIKFTQSFNTARFGNVHSKIWIFGNDVHPMGATSPPSSSSGSFSGNWKFVKSGTDYNYYNTTSNTLIGTITPTNTNISVEAYGQDSCGEGGHAASTTISNLTYYYGTNAINVTFITPTNNQEISTLNSNSTLAFNISTNISISSLSNITLYLNNVQINYSVITGIKNESFFNHSISLLTLGNNNVTAKVCDVDNECFYQYINLNTLPIIINSKSYNATTYETASETYSLNISFDYNNYTSITASLVYNNSTYSSTKTGTGANLLFYKTLDLPSYYLGTNNLYWIINITNSTDTTTYNSSMDSQTVSPIQLGLCNSTLNISYINFTFKDESTENFINSSIDLLTWNYYLGSGTQYKTLIFTNSTANPSYAFCFSPQYKTLKGSQNLQYSNTGYYQRQYSYSSTLTNITKNQVLYLLASTDGLYNTVVVQSSANTVLSGVTVQVERQFGGIWTLLTQQITDSTGSATFFLNPNYDHRFTASKTGYTTSTATIRPTSAQWTLILGSGTGNTTYNNILEGITYSVYPISGFISQNTTYKFGFNISASLSNLVRYKIELVLVNGSILDSLEGTTPEGSNLEISLNTKDYDKIYGKYYVDIGSGYYLIDPSIWAVKNITIGQGSIWAGIKNTMSYKVTVEDNYGQLFFLFLFLFVGISAFTYFSGAELTNPGIILIPIFLFILIFSYMGFFTIDFSPNSFMNKYGITMVALFLSVGFLLGRLGQS